MASNPRQEDFWPPADPLIGMCVRLDRDVDRQDPCHDNLAEVGGGRGPHSHAVFCAMCGCFPGWLPQTAYVFLTDAVRTFGVPSQPLVYRDATIINAEAGAGAVGPSNASAPNKKGD
jgi:hypothetical protein